MSATKLDDQCPASFLTVPLSRASFPCLFPGAFPGCLFLCLFSQSALFARSDLFPGVTSSWTTDFYVTLSLKPPRTRFLTSGRCLFPWPSRRSPTTGASMKP